VVIKQVLKPLPNYHKIVGLFNRANEIRFIRQIKVGHESSNIILSVGIKYSACDFTL